MKYVSKHCFLIQSIPILKSRWYSFSLMLSNMIPLSFFIGKVLADKTHHYTLLDGEMIIDTMPESQKQERRYLIYDVMAINHMSVVEVSFTVKFVRHNRMLPYQRKCDAFVF